MKSMGETTVENYFKALKESDQKLEFHNGEIVAMAGAQPPHVFIHSNFFIVLGNCLKAKGCSILGSDLLVKAGTCNTYCFPDLVIVCQKKEFEKSPNGLEALLNPEIIIEILSPGTDVFDRTHKLDCYKTIPSFHTYVLVSSTKKQVEILTRLSEAEWLSHTYLEKDETISINGCGISFEEMYSEVEFE